MCMEHASSEQRRRPHQSPNMHSCQPDAMCTQPRRYHITLSSMRSNCSLSLPGMGWVGKVSPTVEWRGTLERASAATEGPGPLGRPRVAAGTPHYHSQGSSSFQLRIILGKAAAEQAALGRPGRLVALPRSHAVEPCRRRVSPARAFVSG